MELCNFISYIIKEKLEMKIRNDEIYFEGTTRKFDIMLCSNKIYCREIIK